MKCPQGCLSSLVGLCLGLTGPIGWAQSSIVELPAREGTHSTAPTSRGPAIVSRSVAEFDSAVTNSVDPAILEFEQILMSATWGEVAGSTTEEFTAQALIEKIEGLGIAVILDDSSELKLETPISFRSSPAVADMRLDAALKHLMWNYNSDYQLTPSALVIRSVDEMAERLDRVVYNVTALAPTSGSVSDKEWLSSLISMIQNTVEPESWEYEGPSLVPIARNGQTLLVIVNTYGIHCEIRRLFRNVDTLSGR